MAKIKYSYAIVKSTFGNLWVGKSKRKADGKKYFKTHEQAVSLAMILFEEKHNLYDFDPDYEYVDYEIIEEYDAIQNENEEPDEIDKELEKFII